jgi:hypothetical protein
MNKTISVIVCMILITGIFVVLPVKADNIASLKQPAWKIATIEENTYYVQSTDIAIDPSGNPNVVYGYMNSNHTIGHGKYARWTGSEWLTTEFATQNYSSVLPSMVLDSAGKPWICYCNYGPVKVAKLENDKWKTWNLSMPGVSYPTIALDWLGKPYVCCPFYTTPPLQKTGKEMIYGGLYYAVLNGTSWNCSEIIHGDCDSSSIAVDSKGVPHICYSCVYGGHSSTDILDIRYASLYGSTWNSELLDGTSSGDRSLVMGSNDVPHIVYTKWNGSTGDLIYRKWNGKGWERQTIDTDNKTGSSIAVDSKGNPHVSYIDRNNGELKYAQLVNNTWELQTVDSIGNCWWSGTSIKLDNSDNVYISYFDYDSNSTKIATTGSNIAPEYPSVIFIFVIANILALYAIAIRNKKESQ